MRFLVFSQTVHVLESRRACVALHVFPARVHVEMRLEVGLGREACESTAIGKRNRIICNRLLTFAARLASVKICHLMNARDVRL